MTKRILKYPWLIWGLSCWLLMLPVAKAYADAFGIGSAAEIAKLTQIINQMTTLIERAEESIDLQQKLAASQERAFFRKSATYAREMRKLVTATDRLEGHSFSQDPLKLNALHSDIQEILRQASSIKDGNAKQTLLAVAETLDMLARTEWLTATTDAMQKEMAIKQDSSEEGQFLAGIYNTLADMRHQEADLEARYRLNALSSRQRMLGMYSIFTQEGPM